jgi:glycosyltransferase involved in cell wall biosynthesis
MPSLKGFDLWHATYQHTRYMPVRDRHIKVLLTLHDLNFLYDDQKPEEKKQRYLKRVQTLIDRADALVCISEYTRNDILRHCDTGGKPCPVIYNGSNRLEVPLLLRASYRPRRPFLFSIGVLHRKKNYHALLPLLQRQDLEWLIAGRFEDPGYVALLKKQSEEMGVADRLHLLGRVSEGEKAWYFNHCQAFAFPSVSEGFGLPVVEAMTCGKPLFLSNRTALPEIGGDVSFYFRDFGSDHMEQVFEEGMREYNRNGLRERIRQRGRHFSWDIAAREYLSVYRSLLTT